MSILVLLYKKYLGYGYGAAVLKADAFVRSFNLGNFWS